MNPINVFKLTLTAQLYDVTASCENRLLVLKPNKKNLTILEQNDIKKLHLKKAGQNYHYILCECLGWVLAQEAKEFKFTGLKVKAEVGDIVISIGSIIELR